MFRSHDAGRRSPWAILELIFHASVRSVRKTHGNALWGLLINILQTLLLVIVFFMMFAVLGMRDTAIRGNYLLYIMSGVFLFMTHTKTVAAVAAAEGPTSAMMKHAPMNPVISIAAAALGALYTQVLSLSVLLYGYHAIVEPITIDQPVGALGMLLLSWSTGLAIGMVFLAIKPWSPEVASIGAAVYMRVNMVASGKMFVANAMPSLLLRLFDWNPLFHTIDQGRGFIFLNYHPHYSSIGYPFRVMLACMMIGLMAEFYTRKHASLSWAAGR